MLGAPARTVLSRLGLGYTRLRGRLGIGLEMRSLPAPWVMDRVMNLPSFSIGIFARAARRQQQAHSGGQGAAVDGRYSVRAVSWLAGWLVLANEVATNP